jgi:succinyl-CoA synthetase beta subunit
MNIHEYQAKAILYKRGIPVPRGFVAMSADYAREAFESLQTHSVVVKAQTHAGGRGKAGGVITVNTGLGAEGAARQLLARQLFTAQTGATGQRVDRVLAEERLNLKSELYLSISLDRESARPLAIASARGGMDIEEVAKTDPKALVKEFGDAHGGFETFEAHKIFPALGLSPELLKPFTEIFTILGKTFVELDCSLIELNPLGVTTEGQLYAVDVKMSFDDNALYRHPDIAALRDVEQEDPREVEAKKHDLSYVGLQGNIGCMVNGAGLAMATMDLIRLHGGEPANFLDVGGNTTVEKVVAAFQIIMRDQHVRTILVNISGGIVHCDIIAQGIVEAVRQTSLHVPLVVRLEGTNAAEGRYVLDASGLRITPAAYFEEAAITAVNLAKK